MTFNLEQTEAGMFSTNNELAKEKNSIVFL